MRTWRMRERDVELWGWGFGCENFVDGKFADGECFEMEIGCW